MPAPRAAAAVITLSLAAAVGGCASGGIDRSNVAVASLRDTREQIAAVSADVDRTTAAMRALRDARDLRAAYATFESEVDRIAADARAVGDRADDMQARRRQYVERWQAEMAEIDNAGLRAAAARRRSAIAERYDGVAAMYRGARDQYRAYHRDLTAIRTYLSNDLTRAGVAAAAAGTFEKAERDGHDLKATAAAVMRSLDAAARGIAPGGPGE